MHSANDFNRQISSSGYLDIYRHLLCLSRNTPTRQIDFETEIMTIATSDFIALCSLIVAFFAYRHSVTSSQDNAKQIQIISNTHFQLSSNIAISEASQKYVSLLANVNREFEEIVGKLADPAARASRLIGDTFDDFDSQQLTLPYLRHAFHTAITVVREAYDEELTYQTGLNLVFRLRALKFIKGDVATYQPETPDRSIFSFLKKQNKPNNPEEIINASTAFWDSLKTIYSRIPEEKEAALFRHIYRYIEEYSCLHRESHQRLDALEKQLEDAIKENSLEMYQIRDVPSLGTKFYRVKGDIGRIRELFLPDLDGLGGHPTQDGVAYSLYAACVLYIVSQHYMWGNA